MSSNSKTPPTTPNKKPVESNAAFGEGTASTVSTSTSETLANVKMETNNDELEQKEKTASSPAKDSDKNLSDLTAEPTVPEPQTQIDDKITVTASLRSQGFITVSYTDPDDNATYHGVLMRAPNDPSCPGFVSKTDLNVWQNVISREQKIKQAIQEGKDPRQVLASSDKKDTLLTADKISASANRQTALLGQNINRFSSDRPLRLRPSFGNVLCAKCKHPVNNKHDQFDRQRNRPQFSTTANGQPQRQTTAVNVKPSVPSSSLSSSRDRHRDRSSYDGVKIKPRRSSMFPNKPSRLYSHRHISTVNSEVSSSNSVVKSEMLNTTAMRRPETGTQQATGTAMIESSRPLILSSPVVPIERLRLPVATPPKRVLPLAHPGRVIVGAQGKAIRSVFPQYLHKTVPTTTTATVGERVNVLPKLVPTSAPSTSTAEPTSGQMVVRKIAPKPTSAMTTTTTSSGVGSATVTVSSSVVTNGNKPTVPRLTISLPRNPGDQPILIKQPTLKPIATQQRRSSTGGGMMMANGMVIARRVDDTIPAMPKSAQGTRTLVSSEGLVYGKKRVVTCRSREPSTDSTPPKMSRRLAPKLITPTPVDNPLNLQPKDIVWAKMKSEPFWPAEIYCFNSGGETCVLWLGSDQHGFVHCKTLERFEDTFQRRFNAKRPNKHGYQDAITDGIQRWRERTGKEDISFCRDAIAAVPKIYKAVTGENPPKSATKSNKKKRGSGGSATKRYKPRSRVNLEPKLESDVAVEESPNPEPCISKDASETLVASQSSTSPMAVSSTSNTTTNQSLTPSVVENCDETGKRPVADPDAAVESDDEFGLVIAEDQDQETESPPYQQSADVDLIQQQPTQTLVAAADGALG